jgi:hypothetical protein
LPPLRQTVLRRELQPLKIFTLFVAVFYCCIGLATERGSFPICKNLIAQHLISGSQEKVAFKATTGARFLAELHHNGVVTFDLINRGDNNEILYPDFIPKEAFQRVLEHWGDRVSIIQGVWMKASSASSKQESRNYYEFMDALDRGLSPEEAVFETWTGKQAKAAGFTKCLNITYLFETEENPRNAWKLYVNFGR